MAGRLPAEAMERMLSLDDAEKVLAAIEGTKPKRRR
jgi:hypothetical protein